MSRSPGLGILDVYCSTSAKRNSPVIIFRQTLERADAGGGGAEGAAVKLLKTIRLIQRSKLFNNVSLVKTHYSILDHFSGAHVAYRGLFRTPKQPNTKSFNVIIRFY